ncbi:TPA: hypothetical protein ACH3X1_014702 [Trebouxia sp. C0004]
MSKAKQSVTPAESSSASGGAAAALQCKPPPMSTIFDCYCHSCTIAFHFAIALEGDAAAPGMRVEATMQRPIVQGKVMSLQRSAESSQPKEKAQQGEGASRLPHHQPNAQASKAGRPRKGTTKAARTRRQQAGRKGARKKAEIN